MMPKRPVTHTFSTLPAASSVPAKGAGRRPRAWAAPCLVMAMAWSSSEGLAQRISPQEDNVHKAVSAVFTATEIGSALISLEAALPHDGTVDPIVANLTQSVAKIAKDGDNAVLHYRDDGLVAFTVAVATSQAAIARSSLTRLNTALQGQPLSAETKAALAAVSQRVDDLIRRLRAE